ncbi:DUF6731 family protein [Paenibacillus ferrarius]|uniref:DUF6731 family protein n=1 Tax=Paenibacillus ferrarius TaxID=1469647 RepID=UPI003D2A3BAA
MGKSIHYYNCFISYNGVHTTIDISNFIDRVFVIDQARKFKSLRVGGEMSFPEMVMPDPTNVQTFQNRSVGIAKYRDRKPYTGQRGTDQTNTIPNDVLELTSAVFIPQDRQVLIDYNHYGARPAHIESYFNSFLPTTEGHVWSFELIPIEPERGYNDVINSTDIRHIEFRLNLLQPVRFNQENEETSLLGDLLSGIRGTHLNFGANTATISFGNGKHRRETINARNLIPLIQALDLDSEAFESVKVRYLSPTTRQTEIIDLKNAGVLKREIMNNDDNDGVEYTTERIQADYYANNRPGNSYYLRHGNLIPINLPDLVIND